MKEFVFTEVESSKTGFPFRESDVSESIAFPAGNNLNPAEYFNSSPTKLGVLAEMDVLKRMSKKIFILFMGKYRFNNSIRSLFLFAKELSHIFTDYFQFGRIIQKS